MDQSNMVENSLSKSLTKISGPKGQSGVPEKESPKDPKGDAFSLCGKPSFIICKGRRIPDLIEVPSPPDLRQMQVGEGAILKIQSIVKRQSRIMSLVDWILFRKKEVSHGEGEDLETDDSTGNDEISNL
ncbi:uncharacterized protein [Drosophila pseudoobscura]|uniref:Uncharacterized protein n=1 Tax=Drosophila pseudoobscura pseudoobscura TaxID=46245 RepID=A0A6I8W7E2_DROPS|nr:uncharacterized protein LOC117184709 [Drosophila pseudoobscura]